MNKLSVSTSNPLMDYMRKNSKYLQEEGHSLLAHPVSFDVYNALSSSCEEFADGTKIINGGSFPHVNSFIGKSQSGKTSLALRLGASVVSKFKHGIMFLRDAEHTMQEARILRLTGWTPEQFRAHAHYINEGITHDFIYNEIRMIAQSKENMKNEILIDTGLKTISGIPIKIYPPTVYIIDSLPYIPLLTDDDEINEVNENSDSEDVKFKLKETSVLNNTDGMREAGSTKALLKKTADLLTKYNIHLYIINHITTDINTNAFVRPPKQMIYLKEGEKLPGGATYLYGCFNICRTEYARKIEEGEWGPMIHGHMNRMIMVKNKNGMSGVPVDVFFDVERGYNNIITNWNYIFNRRYGFDGTNKYTLKVGGKSFTKKTLFEEALKDIRETGGKELVAPLEYTARRCMFYDLVLRKPDPDPYFWNGQPSKYSYWN